ncbi:uncharacterized protein LOC131876577 [Cryptomeria japonica]|uniref:uncharacterized protein LOC131876577 n=1 Tax=Cryptomeria japonica TaxID=3369 RepID=UPI0027DA6FC0|nr:uncharacterized protein LOC131876577 [Cryptomeria japonica]
MLLLAFFWVRQKWLGHFVDSDGASGGLGILWNPLVVHVEVVSRSKYWQMVKVISKTMNFSCFLVNVYGPTLAVDKCKLWEDVSRRLEEVRSFLAIVAGDFNATLSSSEKHGGVRRLSRSQLDFQSFVNENALFEVVAKGGDFTWTDRRRGFSNIAEKLDRFFLVGDWNVSPVVFEAEVLAISGSDHFLVSLVVQNDVVPIRCPFKVEKMWFREPSFKELVVGWWKEAPVVEGFLAYQSFKKLSYVKQKLKSWNREVFGNIFDEKRRLVGDLGALNAKVMVEGMDEVDFLTEKDLLSKYGEDVLGEDLLAVVEESRSRGFVLKEFNCTLVALIPKKAKPTGMEEFHPISLCNTIYKIITKVAANRLKLILDKLISCEQSGFNPGRNIVDGVIVAHEAIHTAMKGRQRRMILNLDIQKAYDRVDRSFLVAVLERFGFGKSWIKWISSMIMQFSASSIAFKRDQGLWKGIEIAQGVGSTTHSQFTDDTCLFSVASMREASVMKKFLDRFTWAIGQEINWLKSELFFFHTEGWSQRAIARVFGIKIGQLLGKFLGMPLFAGVGKLDMWKGLLDGWKAKMEGWKSK